MNRIIWAASLCWSLTTTMIASSRSVNLLSVQSTNDTFSSFLPLLTDCNYPTPPNLTFIDYSINLTLLTPQTIFNTVVLENQIIFWSPVKNGTTIYTLLDVSPISYVVYDSPLSPNFSRPLLSYELYDNSTLNLTFTFCSSFNESLLLWNQINSTAFQMNWNCSNSISSISCFNIGQQLFGCLCMESGQIYYWNSTDPTNGSFWVLSAANIPPPYLGIVTNPLIVSDLIVLTQYFKPPQIYQKNEWNFLVLAGEDPTLWFCQQNQSYLICATSFQQRKYYQQLLDLLWGSEKSEKQQQYEILLSTYTQMNSNASIPGNLFSFYVNRDKNAFFEIQLSNGSNCLIIIDSNANLIANLTLPGSILVYGVQNVLVLLPNNSLTILELSLPSLQFTSAFYPISAYTYEIQCPFGPLQFVYTIFWSSFFYPQGQVIPISPLPLCTSTQIYKIYLQDYFVIFGPEYTLFVQEQYPNLDSLLIDSTTVVIEGDILAMFVLSSASSNFLSNIISKLHRFIPNSFTKLSSSILLIYSLLSNSGPTIQLTAMNKNYDLRSWGIPIPCQFQNPRLQQLGNSIVLCQNGKCCICDPFLLNCSFSTLQVESPFLSNSTSEVIYVSPFDNLKIVVQHPNNSIQLWSMNPNSLMSSLTLNCSQNIVAQLYKSEMETMSIFTFCPGQSFLTQFACDDMTFDFLRQIPLYGFQTRVNAGTDSLKIGQNFIFLEVQPLKSSVLYQKEENCCILKINPTSFTGKYFFRVGSAISEVIRIQTLEILQSFEGADIAFYNSTGFQQSSYLKIYFRKTILVLNQTQAQGVAINNYTYNITFLSFLSNFAFMTAEEVSFNLTAATFLFQKGSPLFTINNTQLSKEGTYKSQITLDLSSICGPIEDLTFKFSPVDHGFISINRLFYLDLIVNSKIITRNKEFLQLVSCESFNQLSGVVNSTSLIINNYILVVCVDEILIYAIHGPQFQMSLSANITPIYPSCSYHPYQLFNSTSASFLAHCPDTLDSLMLILTIVINPDLSINSSWHSISSPGSFSSVQVIPSMAGSPALLLGLTQGPSSSFTGELIASLLFSSIVQSILYTSTPQLYLFDYDSALIDGNTFIVTLDSKFISLWINPKLSSPSIPPNYIYPLKNITSSSTTFGIVKILSLLYPNESSLTQSNLKVLISEGSNIVQATLELWDGGTIQSGIVMEHYINCNSYNKFKPQGRVNSQGNLEFVVAECLQNQEIFTVQEIETINSSLPVIYTAYLQLFLPEGPSCKQVWQPARIIPVSISTVNPIFLIYNLTSPNQTSNSPYQPQIGLIYELLQGVLIDSIILLDIQLLVEILPYLTQYQLPVVNTIIENSYYLQNITIQLEPVDTIDPLGVYMMVGLFVFVNAITIICIGCWFYTRKNFSQQKNKSKSKNTEKNEGKINDRHSHPVEIELFTPRYS